MSDTPDLHQAIQDELNQPQEPEPSLEPPPAPPGPSMLSVRGQEVSEDDLASLLEFQSWAESNPDHMRAFAEYLRGEARFVKGEPEPPPPPEPQVPQIDWETVDPSVRQVYEAQHAELEALQERMSKFEEPLQSLQQHQYEAARAEAETALQAATGRISDRFKLNDDEMEDLAQEAAQLQIVPQLRAQGLSPEQAIETALETAFWRSEKWRARAVDEELASRTAGGRKANAAKVAGSSAATGDGIGSSQPIPQNEEDRRAAMAAEIAEALRGTP